MAKRRLPKMRPNLTNPLCLGLKSLIAYDSATPVDLISNKLLVPTNAPQLAYGEFGPYAKFTVATNNRFIAGAAPAVGNGNDVTCIALVRASDPGANTEWPIISNLDNTTAAGWYLTFQRFGGTIGYSMLCGTGAGYIGALSATGGTAIYDKWAVVAGTFKATENTARLYVDGLLGYSAHSGGATGNISSNNAMTIGANTPGTLKSSNHIAWTAVFDRQLSDDEIRKWSTGDWREIYNDYFTFTPSSITVNDNNTLGSTASTNRTGPINASDAMIAEAEIGGTLASPSPTGPVIVYDLNALGAPVPVIQPRPISVFDNGSIYSYSSIPSRIIVSDASLLGSSCRTILNGSQSILASGRYRG